MTIRAIPNSKMAANPAVNLWSTGTHQFAAWIRTDDGIGIGRIERGVQRWGIDHDEYVVGGTPSTTLALPTEADEHNYPSIMVDGNGRIHVWSNMHNDPMRYIRSVDPHTSDTWLGDSGWTNAASELPSVQNRCTYPTPIQFADGSFAFYLRNGTNSAVSGQYDSFMWERTPTGTAWTNRRKVWQGLQVPDGGGPGITGGDDTTGTEDRTNWSVYPSPFVIESALHPYPGRLHVSWIWRCQGIDGESNVWPSYAYSDDKGVTWKTIDGTPLTVPITPLNSVASRCTPACGGAWVSSSSRNSNIVIVELDTTAAEAGIAAGDTIHIRVTNTALDGQFTVGAVGNPTPNSVAWGQAGADIASAGPGSITKRRYFNWAALTIDPLGLPHMIGSVTPVVYIRRNATNTAWVETQLTNPLGGFIHSTRWGGAYWFRDQLWGLSLAQDPIYARRLRMYRVTNPGVSIAMSGDCGRTADWEPSIDMEALRRFGTIETLVPDGDRPEVFTFGDRRARCKAS